MNTLNQLPNHRSNPLKYLRLAIFALSVSYLVVYLWMAYTRLQYPYELEWIEGGMVDEVARLVKGEPIYTAPSLEFVPFLYPPVYFYFSAAASALLGGGIFPLRLVSFVASLVSFWMIFLIVHAETRNGWLALASTGLFAASFRVTGAWLDIGRVDSLFLAFLLVAIHFITSRRTLAGSLLGGACAALAYLTKQTALVICIPIMLYLFYRNWKQGLAFLVASAGSVALFTLVMDKSTSGWFSFYTFALLSQQTQWLPLEFIGFWKTDLLDHLPIALLWAIAFFVGWQKKEGNPWLQWLAIAAGALGGTFITRVKIGGYDNVLLPTFAIFAILFGLGLNKILAFLTRLEVEQQRKLEALVLLACIFQLLLLSYNPFAQLPSKADLNAGGQLLQYLAQVEGEVYLPDHGYLASLAGKGTHAHHSAIWDVLRTDKVTPAKVELGNDLEDAIRQQRFDVIILDSDANFCCKGIELYYTRVGEMFADEVVFYPVTGDKRRPTNIYLANRLK